MEPVTTSGAPVRLFVWLADEARAVGLRHRLGLRFGDQVHPNACDLLSVVDQPHHWVVTSDEDLAPVAHHLVGTSGQVHCLKGSRALPTASAWSNWADYAELVVHLYGLPHVFPGGVSTHPLRQPLPPIILELVQRWGWQQLIRLMLLVQPAPNGPKQPDARLPRLGGTGLIPCFYLHTEFTRTLSTEALAWLCQRAAADIQRLESYATSSSLIFLPWK